MEQNQKCTCKYSESCTAEQESDFVWACQKGDMDKMTQLFNNGACVNSQSMYGSGTLYGAIFSKNIEAVKLLIELGVDINREDRVLQAPIGVAIEMASIDITKLLIESGCEINYEKRRGLVSHYVSIMDAIITCNSHNRSAAEECLRLIIDAGLDIDKSLRDMSHLNCSDENIIKILMDNQLNKH